MFSPIAQSPSSSGPAHDSMTPLLHYSITPLLRSGSLPKPSPDVIVRPAVAGGFEHLLGGADLDEFAVEEEAGPLRDAGGLVHVVGDEDDGVALAELHHEFLDAKGGDRVEEIGRAHV